MEAPKILALHFNFSGVGDSQIGYFPHPSLEEATNSLCNLEQVSQPFSASVPPVKWHDNSTGPHEVVVRIK